MVFSGDDHDYCDVTHANHIREVTIKSFSASAGVRRPGFQLLSLVPPRPGQTSLADKPCSLPDQIGAYYNVYAPLAILTLAFLLITNIRRAWFSSSSPIPLSKREKEPSKFLRQTALPTRKSQQHLSALTMTTPRERHSSPAPSAPTSPLVSPMIGFEDDLEQGMSPSMSRRSSYGAELDSTARPRQPRMLSASDWAAAARAKDVSVLSLATDSRGPLRRAHGFIRWLWRSRNSVWGKSWREFFTVVGPGVLVWGVVNAFFLRW